MLSQEVAYDFTVKKNRDNLYSACKADATLD